MSEIAFSPQRLKEAMGEMSNVDFAAKLGCSKSNISMYLSGIRTPSKMTIQLMAICLGVNPSWLAGLDVDKFIQKPAVDSSSLSERDRAFFDKLESLTNSELLRVYGYIDSMIQEREKLK